MSPLVPFEGYIYCFKIEATLNRTCEKGCDKNKTHKEQNRMNRMKFFSIRFELTYRISQFAIHLRELGIRENLKEH